MLTDCKKSFLLLSGMFIFIPVLFESYSCRQFLECRHIANLFDTNRLYNPYRSDPVSLQRQAPFCDFHPSSSLGRIAQIRTITATIIERWVTGDFFLFLGNFGSRFFWSFFLRLLEPASSLSLLAIAIGPEL